MWNKIFLNTKINDQRAVKISMLILQAAHACRSVCKFQRLGAEDEHSMVLRNTDIDLKVNTTLYTTRQHR
jgi:hypothetical protein